jgi:hypothetical protein
MIKLIVQPDRAPFSWEEFVRDTERYSIAIDGCVSGAPNFDANKYVANFNHHENVNRLATRATCAQVLMAVRQGLFQAFRDNNEPQATVFANDCDEDVCTSWYILNNHAFCEQPLNPLLNRLVMMEDALDATAGAYPFPADLPVLKELAWVFEPYRLFRLSGQLDQKSPRAFRGIIEDVENRIHRHITGSGLEIPLDTRYERIGGGAGWVMVKELGAQARTGMFADGIKAYISVRQRSKKQWTYTLGRLSTFIPFDLIKLYKHLNEAEDLQNNPDCWGGSDTIGGSPRVRGSSISPDQICDIIKKCLN